MFTGLVAGVGRVVSATPSEEGIDLSVDLGALAGAAGGDAVGDSVALSGVCCTVTRIEGSVRWFVLTPETIRRTWLGTVAPGRLLNIEKPLRVGDPLGGHVVQGHVDGVGEVVSPVDPQHGGELWVTVPGDLARYCVEKGSIALDGISLTIARLEDRAPDPGGAGSGPCRIMVAVIPHTAQVTSVAEMGPGQPIHVEVDVLAKYVERLLGPRT